MQPTPIRADLIALVHRSLLVCAELTDRLLQLPENSPRNPAADYGFLSRGMRQNVLLLERLADAPAVEAPKSTEDAAARPAAAREQALRRLEDAIHRFADGRDPDALRAEALERLADENLLGQLDTRPVHDVVAALCRDLHLIPSYKRGRVKRRTPADIAALHAAVATLPPPATPPTPLPAPPPALPGLPRILLLPEPSAAPSAGRPECAPEPPAAPLIPRRRRLSTPSLILPPGPHRQAAPTDRPEADARDLR